MTKIILTGGTGNIGKTLTKTLEKIGNEVYTLTRNPKTGNKKHIFWDPEKGILDPKDLADAESIIHLAGAGVADHRWTQAYKDEIMSSRVLGTRLLAKALAQANHKLKSFVSASAVGIYGTHPTGIVSEDYPADVNFLAQVCVAWEEETKAIANLGIPVSIARIGIVLSKDGGFVKEIGNLAKSGLAAPLGNGKMIVPWIHVDDLCRMLIFLSIHPELQGPFNAVAPNVASNAELTKLIAKNLNRPAFLPPVPGFMLKLMMGEMGQMLLSDQNISAQKICASGFGFNYLYAKDAITQILKK
jgi:hypothetical protein